jgi:hypothetical protein
LLGKIAKKFIAVLQMPDLLPLNLLQIAVAVGRNLLESAKLESLLFLPQFADLMEKLLQR